MSKQFLKFFPSIEFTILSDPSCLIFLMFILINLLRFRSFSCNQIKTFIKKNLDSSTLNNDVGLILQDFISSSNGSPRKIINDIKIWKELPSEIKNNLNFPLSDRLEILKKSKIICEELAIDKQIFLINFLQIKYWRETKNKNIIKKLEDLKVYLKNFFQPRFAWEVTLLKIAIEDL